MALRDHLIWWSGLVAFPVLAGQALYVRRKTPLLPSAPSPHRGTYTPDAASLSPGLSIYLIGESTVAGVGARDHEHGLSGQLARQLGTMLSLAVRWEAIGLAGVRARECLEGLIELELAPRLRPPFEQVSADLLVIVLGVNDTTKLTSRARWRRAIEDIIVRCRRETECPIVFTGIPTMHHFTALPWPLRSVVGARARLLDDDLLHITEAAQNCHHHSIDVELDGDDLAVDGFHPSETGYARWAEDLARRVAVL